MTRQCNISNSTFAFAVCTMVTLVACLALAYKLTVSYQQINDMQTRLRNLEPACSNKNDIQEESPTYRHTSDVVSKQILCIVLWTFIFTRIINLSFSGPVSNSIDSSILGSKPLFILITKFHICISNCSSAAVICLIKSILLTFLLTYLILIDIVRLRGINQPDTFAFSSGIPNSLFPKCHSPYIPQTNEIYSWLAYIMILLSLCLYIHPDWMMELWPDLISILLHIHPKPYICISVC